MTAERPPKAESELLTRAEFDTALTELGGRLPTVKRLISNEHPNFNFDKWPEHLKRDAYAKVGLEPVVMYRRIQS